MAVKMVFFDLDGTLLPMDMDEFTMGYFKMLAAKAAPRGYELQLLVRAIWHGVSAMVRNDGHCTNEDAFWEDFAGIYGRFCGYNPEAAATVRWIKAQGFRVALATNPLFPAVATESRISWTGLAPDEFEFYTTYENIGWCKPNPDYYREVLRRAGLSAEECMMVGNDVGEDMVAADLGMKVFLLKDCLINKSGEDIGRYPNGSFAELREYVAGL